MSAARATAPAERAAAVRGFLLSTLAARRVGTTEEDMVIAGEGKTFRLTAAPIEPGAEHLVLLVEDVTLAKRLERQMLLTERLTTAGRLAAGVAHNINNRLTPVLGWTEMLLERLAAGEQLIERRAHLGHGVALDDVLERVRRLRHQLGARPGMNVRRHTRIPCRVHVDDHPGRGVVESRERHAATHARPVERLEHELDTAPGASRRAAGDHGDCQGSADEGKTRGPLHGRTMLCGTAPVCHGTIVTSVAGSTKG